MIHFRIAKHNVRPHEQVVEIWSNDRFIACLYGLQGECGLTLVSKYLPATERAVTGSFYSDPTPFIVLNPTDPVSMEIRFKSPWEPRT